jgi:hypothetical protein
MLRQVTLDRLVTLGFKPETYTELGFHLHERLDSYAFGLVEATCEHGIGHPIPESVQERDINGPSGSKGYWGVHGCDGCCRKFNKEWDNVPV